MIFEIVNPEDVPDDLPPGRYRTEVVSSEFLGSAWVIKVRYLGGLEDPNNRTSLLPLIKESDE